MNIWTVRRSFLDGMAWVSAFLGVMSLLAVAAFHFPELLTTPQLREVYTEDQVFLLFLPAHWLEATLALQALQDFLSGLPLLVQVFLIMLVTDLAQYWVHRAFHQLPFLWRFHRIHHSVEKMDWLAGSRLHIVDVITTRSLSLVPMVFLGFSVEAINIYLPILALQSVFIHCNLEFELAWLQKFLTTPKYHHWHHTSDAGHLDKNFAVSLPFLDRLFGTYYSPRGEWPAGYGLAGDKLEERYITHLLAPFKGWGKKRNSGG